MRNVIRILIPGLGLLASALIAAPSSAAPPALMLTQYSLQAQGVFGIGPGTVSSGAFAAGGSPSPTGPEVSVHGDGPSSVVTADNEASAQALWSFEIVGPANVAVPIIITGLYSADMSNAFGVSGGIGLGQDRFRLDRIFTFRCIAGDASGCNSSRGGLSQDFRLNEAALSGAETFMQISVGGTVKGALSGTTGTFNAFIDPLISIDPAFARAGRCRRTPRR